jgi:hypothetical protein
MKLVFLVSLFRAVIESLILLTSPGFFIFFSWTCSYSVSWPQSQWSMDGEKGETGLLAVGADIDMAESHHKGHYVQGPQS